MSPPAAISASAPSTAPGAPLASGDDVISLVLQDPYANSFKPRWRGVPDWPAKADRATGKGGWVAERKCVCQSWTTPNLRIVGHVAATP